jgi:hypothetical protein
MEGGGWNGHGSNDLESGQFVYDAMLYFGGAGYLNCLQHLPARRRQNNKMEWICQWKTAACRVIYDGFITGEWISIGTPDDYGTLKWVQP